MWYYDKLPCESILLTLPKSYIHDLTMYPIAWVLKATLCSTRNLTHLGRKASTSLTVLSNNPDTYWIHSTTLKLHFLLRLISPSRGIFRNRFIWLNDLVKSGLQPLDSAARVSSKDKTNQQSHSRVSKQSLSLTARGTRVVYPVTRNVRVDRAMRLRQPLLILRVNWIAGSS